MIVKLITLLIHLVRIDGTNSQLLPGLTGTLVKNVGQVGDIASEVASEVTNTTVYSASRIAESLAGLIENFTDFKKIFNRTYSSKEEEARREKIFAANLAAISGHNELFRTGKEKFSLAMNKFGDWTEQEYLSILGMMTPGGTTVDAPVKKSNRQKRATACQFPNEKNWTKEGAVSPAEDQSKCESCWAFASAAAIEAHYYINSGERINLSKQHIVDCAGRGRCKGGLPHDAYDFSSNHGIVTSDKYPYVGNGTSDSCKKHPSGLKIAGYREIKRNNEEDLKDAVCRFGPVVVGIDARSTKFQYLHNEIYSDPDCSNREINDLNHAVLVVGYGHDEETNEPYWLIKNSFGNSWGANGFGRLARNHNNFCGIASYASYPIVSNSSMKRIN